VVRLSGGRPKRLTEHPADDLTATFSRDGRFIYFSSNRAVGDQIWRMPASGGEPLQVTKHGGYVALESEDGASYAIRIEISGRHLENAPPGGDEESIVGAVADGSAFTVRSNILFYASGPYNNPHPTLYALNLRNRQRRAIVDLKLPVGMRMSVSSDLRTLLYTERNQPGSDLTLVENIRR